MSLLRQFMYQRRSAYPSQRGEGAENDRFDSSFESHTPNKAPVNSIPESSPPSQRFTGSSRHQFVCLRRDGCRKRYNRLSSSSEGEEEGEFEGKDLTPMEMIQSRTPVTIFSKLPASKRKKRILQDGSDGMEGQVQVGSMELGCTKETCAIYKTSPTCMKNSSCLMSSRTRDQKERIRLDSDSSNNSDSCDLCSSTSGSSVEAPSEYPDKGNVSSPIRLSELPSFTFCHRDVRGEASAGEADQADFKQENINTSLLITDCNSPLLPQTVQHPAPSTEDESENEFSDKQKDAILKFLNDSSEDELCDIHGCSLTKAKLLIQHLPLSKWEDLVDVLTSTKGLSEQLLNGCLKLLEDRNVLVKLLSKCHTISSSLQEKLLQLKTLPSSSKELMVGQCIAQPSILSSSLQLKPYQLIGLNWLALLHSMDLNGILADEMGLGKTIQIISFLAYLYESGCQGPFLVIVPSSTLDNWARELEVWCPHFRVLMYLGSRAERAEIRCGILYNNEEYNVILSTYGVCIGQVEDRKFLRKLSLQCLVLDEGHMLKNMASQRYSHLMKIKAKRRVLLTGTPLQNNLLELISLLSFVMPEVFQGCTDLLKKTFSRAKRVDESSVYYNEQVSQAKQIMQPFILRRLKSEVMSELPSKDDSVEYCQLNELQQQLYSNTVDRSKNETMSENSKAHNIIMELRKAANHPLLLLHRYTNAILRQMSQDILSEPTYRDADPNLVYEDMTVMADFELHRLCSSYPVLHKYCLSPTIFGESGKLEFLARKLDELKMENDRILLFSQFTMMLDIIEVFLQQRRHTYLRLDGQTPTGERQTLIDKFNQDSSLFVFLLSTRAGGLGINLTSANVVVIHDIDFNPYNDKQAEDRCHRIGQNKEVKVIRLVSRGTIEEVMLQHAQMKLRLEKDITYTGEGCADVASLLKQGLGFTSDVH